MGNAHFMILHDCSVYAISRLGQSSFFLGKFLWFAVLIVALSGSIYRIEKFSFLYKQYPVVVSLKMDRKQSLMFPAVTVCNINRLKTEGIRCLIPSNMKPNSIGPPLIFSESRELYFCKTDQNSSRENEKDQLQTNFLTFYYSLSERSRFELGHNPMDFMANCSFNGRLCSRSRFRYFTDFRFGNCITFNNQRKGMSPLKISNAGVDSGLILRLKLESSHYLKVTHTSGARVVIHDPSEAPNPDQNGFNVSPGFETTISLKQTVYHRLPAPYKDYCLDYKAQTTNFMKSKDACVRTCMQQWYLEKCGCIDRMLSSMNDQEFCRLTNATEACCLVRVLEYLAENEITCNCPLPCNSVYFNEKVSSAVLSPQTFINRTYCERGSSKTIIKEDYVRLNIFYSSLERQIYEQRPKWETPEFLSFLGNELGLWLGISLLTLFDLFEKLVIFIKHEVVSRIFCGLQRKLFVKK
ncbi:Acid-sensing ion channel 1 [Araneus ventricosus]|uniref:Acid-sensing ion channel 1 n=1 Tax=Araneus ventricosus TaxID=182803 RepID=A0A4Y2IH83_ARAVE|nr:Acid-sensing ion channel 1 [Araneus ventricosus]